MTRPPAVVLAGGAGLRLREVVRDLPKPMAPVGGKPFLEYLMNQLRKWEFREIILATGYRAQTIESFFGNGAPWDLQIGYSRETHPLGTGGAVREALRYLDSDNFLLMNGDSFADLDLGTLQTFHAAFGGIGTLGLVHRDDCSRYGRVEVDGEGRILSFIEKGNAGPGWINSGVGYFRRSALFDRIPPGVCSLERDVFPGLLPDALGGYAERTFFIDIGVPEDYRFVRDHPGLLSPGDEPAR